MLGDHYSRSSDAEVLNDDHDILSQSMSFDFGDEDPVSVCILRFWALMCD